MRWISIFAVMLSSISTSNAYAAQAIGTERTNESLASELLDIAYPVAIVIEQNKLAINDELSNLFNTSEPLIARSNNDPKFRTNFFADANNLIEYVIHQNFSLYRDQYIAIYNANLSRQELQTLLSFYRTPTGQKMSRIAITGAAHSNASTHSGSVNDGKNKALDSIDSTDLPALNLLVPLAKNPKFKKMTVQIQELSSKQFSEITETIEFEFSNLIRQSLSRTK